MTGKFWFSSYLIFYKITKYIEIKSLLGHCLFLEDHIGPLHNLQCYGPARAAGPVRS